MFCPYQFEIHGEEVECNCSNEQMQDCLNDI